jgi:hypothetical protein
VKTIEIEQTELTVPELAALAKKGPIILTRRGKPLASVKDLSGKDWDAVSLANNPRFLDLIAISRSSFQKEGGLTIDEVRKELGLSVKRRTSYRPERGEGM